MVILIGAIVAITTAATDHARGKAVLGNKCPGKLPCHKAQWLDFRLQVTRHNH